MATEYPDLLLPDAAAWRAWLEQHHADSPGVRLILGRKGGTVTALDYAGALDEALCFGWIDGQSHSRDDESFFQRFTPRRPRSSWSLRNVGHIERLENAGPDASGRPGRGRGGQSGRTLGTGLRRPGAQPRRRPTCWRRSPPTRARRRCTTC